MPSEVRRALIPRTPPSGASRTDTQWAFCEPIRKYMDDKKAYLQSQLGNPEGDDKPNKKYIDPRNWLYLGEKGLTARLVQAFKDLNAFGQFEF